MANPFVYTEKGTTVRIDTAPEAITFAASEERLERQGGDAFAADPDGLVLSRDWQLSVGGHEVPVYAAPVTSGGPASFASLSYVGEPGEITLVARSARPVLSACVRPLSLGLEAEVKEQEILIPISGPCKLIVETNEGLERPLFVTVHAEERDVPDASDPKVIYYGPGLHKVSKLELSKGQTLYIAGGAVLQAFVPEDEVPVVESDWAKKKVYQDFIVADGAEDIRIIGRGIIDLSRLDWHARKAMLIQGSEGVHIEGLTIVGTSHWTIHLSQSKDCAIEDITLIGYRENSDGIDIVNCQKVSVSDCLIRTGDDAVAVKAMAAPPVLGGRDITVRRCTVWNDKVRCLGIAGETRTDIHDVVFEDCDIVHSVATWTEELGSLCITVGDSGTISGIRFENIRIEDERQYAMVCLIFKDRWSIDSEPGHIRDIVFRNVHIPQGVPSLFHGSDSDHRVEDVRIEGLFADGKAVSRIEEANFRLNDFVSRINLSGK
ncbi:glycosyl hydrolase family 28 protein [Gorillibacterium massiliense]|uniref:glycosyl hydrolase family 28 protein n=1 Tax=Gorillibacterium massiliense TaxID=1280390 RepID=UPI0004B35CE8|nr:glycosyl hydrolase family 28 protein [Gorillibacterium massiliense]